MEATAACNQYISCERLLRYQLRCSELLQRISDSSRKDHVAIVDNFGSMTYGELDDASATVALAIVDGIERGLFPDFQTVSGFNAANRYYVVSIIATWKANKRFLPLCIAHPEHELKYFLEDSNTGLVLHSPNGQPSFVDITTMSVPCLNVQTILSTQSPASHDSFCVVGPILDHEDALILYTSGTTARPKGVLHTHHGITAMMTDLVESWQITENDKILHFLPLHHIHGLLNKLLCLLFAGGIVEFLASAQASLIWNKLAAEATSPSGKQVTIFMAVPTVYARMLEFVREAKSAGNQSQLDTISTALLTCHAMRLTICGSAALPDVVLAGWKDLTGHMLLERYGMTEVGMALSNPYLGERKSGHVGKPLPSVSCIIVDDSGAVITDVETPGELRLKGPTVFKEYLNRPEDTAAAFDANGWFKTGDVAVINEFGEYRLSGRMSADIIKCNGYKISALEIERELLSHPQVLEAVVVGVNDDMAGERLVAIILPRVESSSEPPLLNPQATTILVNYLKTKLGAYKIPRTYVIVDKIPRNAVGKVNKKELKADIAVTHDLLSGLPK